MNDVYNYSNNINNDGSISKKKKTSMLILISVLVIAIVLLIIFNMVSKYKEKEKVEGKGSNTYIIEIKDFNSIDNYTFEMHLDFVKDTNVVIDVSGVANLKKNIEEFNFIYNSESYHVVILYKTGQVYIYDANNTLVKETTTSSLYTLNLENIINKIQNKSSDVVDFKDGHYSVKVDLNIPNDVYADVYVEDGYVTKVTYDLSNLLTSEGYSKYKVAFTLYNYNDKDLM